MSLRVVVFVAAGLLWVGGCAGSLAWGGPRVDYLIDGSGAVESGMHRGVPYVMASVNGHEPMKFLFDTGASIDVLTTESARKLGVETKHYAMVTSSTGIERRTPFVVVDEIEFGPVTKYGMGFIVHDFEEFTAHFGDDIAGIIGINGLEEFTVDIDYPGRQLSITHERLSVDDPATSVMNTREDGLLMVPVEFVHTKESGLNRTIWSLLDTGNVSKFHIQMDEAKTILNQDRLIDGHASMGLFGIPAFEKSGPMDGWIRVGSTRLEGVNASSNRIESRLNSGVMRNFRVKIDMKSGLVSFTRSDAAQRVVSVQQMGISHLWRFKGYRVDRVLKGSAAYRMGIRAFDEVMLIDGKEPSILHDKTLYWAADEHAEAITVRIGSNDDDGWVDIELPIDGSVGDIEERAPINKPSETSVIILEDVDG